MKLQSQLIIALMPILLIAGGTTTLLTRQAVHKVVIEEVANRGLSRLGDIEKLSHVGFEKRSELVLLPLMTALVRQEHAVYAMALDQNGKVLADTNVLDVGSVLSDPITQAALHSEDATHVLASKNGEPVLDLALPVRGRVMNASSSSEAFLLSGAKEGAGLKRLGTLRVGLPLTQAYITERKIIRQIGFLLLLMGSSILGVGILAIRKILQPADHLVEAADQISRGVYGTTVPVPAATELARLANSFNQMTSILSQTTVSKDFLDSILANMLDPLLVIQPNMTIRMVNSATEKLLGFTSGELVARSAVDLIEDGRSLLNRVIFEQKVSNVELNLKLKGGGLLPTLFSGSAWRDSEGQLRGLIVVVKDLTERKKIEKDVLQSEKLSAVGRLASGVAHEINNPLGVILGFSQELVSEIAAEHPWSFPLKSIEREALRCRDLVQDLLTFSRVSKTGLEPIDLNEAVKGALSLVAAQTRTGRAQLVKELADNLPPISANINQIQQVVINLANNALDAMENSGLLTIRTSVETDGDQQWVCLRVTDTGSGIPPEILPRIFEPFFTTKPIGKGTGLGLGLVHEIVEKHAGKIAVQSRPGETEFCVKFLALEKTIKREQ